MKSGHVESNPFFILSEKPIFNLHITGRQKLSSECSKKRSIYEILPQVFFKLRRCIWELKRPGNKYSGKSPHEDKNSMDLEINVLSIDKKPAEMAGYK